MNSVFFTNNITISNPVIMKTDTVTKILTLEVKVKVLRCYWYYPTKVYFIFYFSHLKEKHRIAYDSDKEDTLLVHKKPIITIFKATQEGPYTIKIPNIYLNDVPEKYNIIPSNNINGTELSHILYTVKQNRIIYTQRQIERSKSEIQLYHIILNKNADNYKHPLRQNTKKCPVKIDDVNLVENIFGPDIGTQKGKITRKNIKPVKDDVVEIPTELIEQQKYLTHFM